MIDDNVYNNSSKLKVKDNKISQTDLHKERNKRLMLNQFEAL